MKPSTVSIGSKINQIAHRASVALRRRKISLPANTGPGKGSLILAALLVSLTSFGQTIYTWTNSAGGDIATAANWNPNGQPSGATIDTAMFDGVTTGPLTVTSSTTSLPSTGYGSSGIILNFTANQVSSVTFTSTVAQSAAYGLNSIQIDSPAAAITIGASGYTSGGNIYNLFGRPAGAVHPFVNNSTQPATINGGVRWQAGGGNAYTLDFLGTGDWVVNNYCVNDNNAGMLIQVDGPGTTTWNPTGYLGNSGLDSPFTINAGKLVLTGAHPKISNQAWVNNGTFQFNAPSQSQLLSGAISGTGTNIISGGTLTLSSGQSTYTGDTILQGGSLVVNGAENPGISGPLGLGGVISFTGGTLVYTVNNVFDYSPRFVTTGGQAFSIDTAGQNVIYADAAGLSGAGSTLTKLGGGTLTLAGPSAYTGLTTVSAGRLVFQGSKTGSASITVADSAALGVTDTGTQVTPATLTVGTSSGATLEFNNVNNTTTAPLAPTTLASAGTIIININSGSLAPATSYPLLAWTSGSAPAVSLGVLNGFIGNLTTNGNSIQLNVVATAYKWTGNNSGIWDLATANNWQQNGGPALFVDGGPVLFDDTLSANELVTIAGVVQPTSITVNNNNTNYTITSSAGNLIGGSASLVKSGSGVLTLAGGANTNTGVTTLSGGILSVSTLANGGAASDIGAASSAAANLVLNGGRLQYLGSGVSLDRLFTITTAGGTIDASGAAALRFTNSGALGYSGNGARTLTLTGATVDTNTLAAPLADNGGTTTLTKNGAGTWVLAGNNTYSGVTTIANGILQIGASGASGTLGTGNIVNNGNLDFNRTGTVTVTGAISGSGSVTNDGAGTVVLTANSSYTGGTTINAGALQAGNGGATGQLPPATPIVNNGNLIFNTTGSYISAGFFATISGTGNVWVQKGFVKTVGQNTYTGWTRIDSGASFQVSEGNQGSFLSSVVTNNGTLVFGRQDNLVFGYSNNIAGSGRVLKEVNNTQGGGDITLAGTNTYTGGTFIAGGGVILGDGINPLAGSIVGPVIFTNSPVGGNPRFLGFNRPDDFTFTNNISTVVTSGNGDSGQIQQNGPNTVTLTGNISLNSATVINAGTLVAGNGGTTGKISPGTVTDNGTLVINLSTTQSLGTISGAGSFVQLGSGTTTLTASNSATGFTTVSNGTLVVSGGYLGGDLNVEGGTIAPAAAGTVATLTVAGNMYIDSGTILVTLNKSLAQSNSLISVTNELYAYAGTINATGGKLNLINFGPQLKVGDKFTVFSGPVYNGDLMTVVGQGFTVQNNLAVDGSVTVTGVSPAPTLTGTVSGGNLNLSWPSTYTGYVVQVQTNSLAVGLSTNWVTIPGTDAGNTYSAPLVNTNKAVFYRLAP